MEAYWFSILGVLALCLLSVMLAVYSGLSKGFAGMLSSLRTTTTGSTGSTACT